MVARIAVISREHGDWPETCTMNVIRQLAEEFIDQNLDMVEPRDIVPKARASAGEIDSKADRTVFITLILEAITKEVETHRRTCSRTDCAYETTFRKVSYFLQQELARLDVVVDQDAFTSSERDSILNKLDSVLRELEQIKAGQAIIAQDVEDLKDLMYMGKKKWQRQFVGTVSDWVAAGLVSEAVAKPMLGAMREFFNQLPGLPVCRSWILTVASRIA